MAHNIDSDSPPPFIPTGDSQHELRAVCAATFATLTSSLRGIHGDVKGMRREVQEIGQAQAAFTESAKGLWHEVRDDINPTVAGMPDKISNAITVHSSDCLARRKALKKAEGDSGDAIDVREIREQQAKRGWIRSGANGDYEVPKAVLWFGAAIGAAVAASGYLMPYLQKLFTP